MRMNVKPTISRSTCCRPKVKRLEGFNIDSAEFWPRNLFHSAWTETTVSTSWKNSRLYLRSISASDMKTHTAIWRQSRKVSYLSWQILVISKAEKKYQKTEFIEKPHPSTNFKLDFEQFRIYVSKLYEVFKGNFNIWQTSVDQSHTKFIIKDSLMHLNNPKKAEKKSKSLSKKDFKYLQEKNDAQTK